MPLKSILVHLADDEDHVARMNLGLKLARAHDAHLRALFLTRPAQMPAGVVGRGASMSFMNDAKKRAEGKADELRARFDQRCAHETVSHDWIVEDGEHADRLARHAHVADLVIVSQSAPHAFEDRLRLSLGESITMAAGCPTLCLPRGFEPDAAPLGRNVLVAWREDREAVRAVRGAIPILQDADTAHVVTVAEDGQPGVHPQEVADYLQRHGVKAQAWVTPRRAGKVADNVIAEAKERGCDLIVFGAYGRSTIREILLGGVSRRMYKQGDLAVLASH